MCSLTAQLAKLNKKLDEMLERKQQRPRDLSVLSDAELIELDRLAEAYGAEADLERYTLDDLIILRDIRAKVEATNESTNPSATCGETSNV